MGASSSKKAKAGKEEGQSGSPSSGVKKRENPNRSNRPLSDPGVGNYSDVNPYPTQNPNVFLRQKDDQDLSGRKYGGLARAPTYHGGRADVVRHNSDRRRDYNPEPRKYYVAEPPLASILQEATSPALDTYHRAVNQLIVERPEYEPLREIDFSSLSQPVLDTLAQLFGRLNEQKDLTREVEKLSVERRDLDHQVRQLGDDRRFLAKENRDLREDVKILRDELRKRGAEERDRLMSSGTDRDNRERLMSSGTDRDNRERLMSSGTDRDNRERLMSSGTDRDNRDRLTNTGTDSDQGSYEPTPRSGAGEEEAPVGKKGIYMPTPLLQAEGGPDKTRNVVSRKESLRPVGQTRPAGYRTQSESTDNDQIRKLQNENAELQERMKALERERHNPYASLPRRSLNAGTLTAHFTDLQREAFNKVATNLKNHLGHVNDTRQRQFICSVMQVAYDISSKTVTQFRETVQGLLLNPLKLEISPQTNEVAKPSNKAAVNKAKKQFEEPSKPRNISKLAARTLEASKVPEALNTQIDNYLENMSDSINLASLIEAVMDAMSSQYSECVTSAVLNQAVFTQFTHDCCRTAWQMSVIIPPLYVTVGDNHRFDDRHHVAFDGEKVVTNAKISYYVWPELLSQKGGDVLHKGRVCLKK